MILVNNNLNLKIIKIIIDNTNNDNLNQRRMPVMQLDTVTNRGRDFETVTSRCQCWNPKLKKYEEAHWIEKTVAGLAPPGLIW